MVQNNPIFKYAKAEKKRQRKTLSLIASENTIYPEILKLASFPLSNKYSEGYPGRRFYAGCKYIDEIEKTAIEEAKKAFGCKYANVQCYSGSIANFCIYKALISPGDTILSMDLTCGGHLTHSSPHSFVSQFYRVVTYSVNRKTSRLDYEEIRRIALESKPKLIIAGSSSYPFQIDFKRFKEIASEVNAYLLADICHLSAFIITSLHPHCFPYADVAMCTTHKQIRGTRGALILWNNDSLTIPLNKSVFPGLQGGMNPSTIAMNAMALQKANEPKYLEYAKRVLKFSNILCQELMKLGVEIIGGGTETHMFLIDTVKSFNLNGDEASSLLEKASIISNKNVIPFDCLPPNSPSGLRIGTLILATLKAKEEQIIWLANQIYTVLKNGDSKQISKVRKGIKEFMDEYGR